VRARVLVVDDERNLRLMLEQMLQLAEYEVEAVESGEQAIARAADGDLDAVLLDVRLGDMDGLHVLDTLRRCAPDVAVVMMSGHGTIETAVAAVRAGAFDFLEKPLGRDKTLLTLENALRLRQLTRENQRLRARTSSTLIGDSPLMVALRERIAQVGPTQARVLIVGESGTGKELIAQALHESSSRAERSFLPVNCAAIPAELIESELFGHVRGAFTGATTARAGVFETAHGGTLFLDEIGDMPAPLQAKLLRVLETGEVTRVGTNRAVRVDVRVVAATHQDLGDAVETGRFREDLYHRLNVVPLTAPPLRDRAEDIPQLAEFFLAREVREQKLGARRFSPEALRRLGRHSWPGNVRELRNLVERLAILCRTSTIDADLVAAELPIERNDAGESTTLRAVVEEAERRAIQAAIRGASGNVSEAARRLGLERSHLYKKARSLGIPLAER
jgi:DNA-binding NtrC family response regulator